MMRILICVLSLSAVPALAAPSKEPKVKGVREHIDVTNLRRPSGSGAAPCAADIERMKGAAAESLAKLEIDSDRHKLEVTPASFTSAEVWSTDANDASVLHLGGKARIAGNGRQFSVHAQAVCSPSSGKFELMSTHYSN